MIELGPRGYRTLPTANAISSLGSDRGDKSVVERERAQTDS